MDFLLNILSHWESALAVLLVLGGLIFFHELGHFAVARLFRIGVRTFSLGFGPKLLKLRRGKTDYCLSLIPLGGYVALAGEEDEAEQPDPKGKEIDGVLFAPEELYSGRPAWHRLLVVLAGPVANFVLALIIYCGIAWAQGQTYLLPEVGDVTPGTPAATAGIQPGDRVLSIDGKPIENWNAVAEGIGAGNGKPVTIVLSRGGSEVTLSLTPEAKTRANIFGEEKPAWLIGIRASTATGHLPLGPVEAIGAGFRQTWDMIAFTCESFVKLAQRVVPLDNVGGPILIAQMVGQQAEQGLSAVLLLAALISVNLGILNLLPIPILDGGHIVFFTLEMLMGRPVSATAREWSAKVGMALLLGAVVLLYWQNTGVARTVGTLTLLAAVAWRLLPTMNKLVQQLLMMQQQIPQIEPVLRKLDEVAALPRTDTATAQECPLQEELRLEDVSFRYPNTAEGKPDALRHLNIRIPRGSMVGFVGPSGAGKSTIVGLLTGLFPPTDGRILVDGRPMDAALREGWIRRIGYVPQSPFLLNASIAENVAFSHWGADIGRERVCRCCRMAAMDFVDDLDQNIDTVIGERGVRLSGGQVQRVAIARALYNDPQFILFDEATSALDGAAEQAIQQTINHLRAHMTLVVVAHRLSTVEACDYVYWVDKGYIRMEGKPGQVLPAYAAFLADQNALTGKETSES